MALFISDKNASGACEPAVFSLELVSQGYRYWAGIGVLQSCESALTHYRLVANHGIYFFFFFCLSPYQKKQKTMELTSNTSIFVVLLEIIMIKSLKWNDLYAS